jgi:hypothetical protein
MIFYKGGMSYEVLINMPIPELFYWNKIACDINEERQKEVERSKRGF